MFKEFICIGSKEYKIIDDTFEEIVDPNKGSLIEIIEVYSKRNLSVAPNLIRAMLYIEKKYRWDLNDQFNYIKNYYYYWPIIEKDMKKYLLFS